MHQCILRLLSQPEDEESLECLCRLLSTIGKELETPGQTAAGRSASTVCSLLFLLRHNLIVTLAIFLFSQIENL